MKFKKRYIATPILLIAIALTWNIVLRQHPPEATAEEINHYLHPQPKDPRHPIDVYQFNATDGNTESDILAKIPAPIYPEDKVRFVIDPGYGIGSIVQVARAMPVTIHDGKKEIVARTWDDTVEELLNDLHRPLGDLDKADVAATDQLAPNMIITITRVAKTKVTTKESVAYETTTKEDPTLDRGKSKVTEDGKNGERTKVFEVTREDGEEVSRKLLKDEVTTKPKNKVVIKGTKIKVGKTATGKATWYDLCCTKVASNSFRKGTVLKLTNLSNGKSIEVKVDDTGAFGSDVVVDLAPSLFKQLGGTEGQGVISRVKAEEILNP
jgi:rare lipoprotein A (peptidoglycan hydrolase)